MIEKAHPTVEISAADNVYKIVWKPIINPTGSSLVLEFELGVTFDQIGLNDRDMRTTIDAVDGRFVELQHLGGDQFTVEWEADDKELMLVCRAQGVTAKRLFTRE